MGEKTPFTPCHSQKGLFLIKRTTTCIYICVCVCISVVVGGRSTDHPSFTRRERKRQASAAALDNNTCYILYYCRHLWRRRRRLQLLFLLIKTRSTQVGLSTGRQACRHIYNIIRRTENSAIFSESLV